MINRFLYFIKFKIFGSIIHFFQKLFIGYSKRELWNLDTTISNFIYPRIQKFKKNVIFCPADLTLEKWIKILTYIEYAFKCHVALNDINSKENQELNVNLPWIDIIDVNIDENGNTKEFVLNQEEFNKIKRDLYFKKKRYNIGLNLFSKYFKYLWN